MRKQSVLEVNTPKYFNISISFILKLIPIFEMTDNQLSMRVEENKGIKFFKTNRIIIEERFL